MTLPKTTLSPPLFHNVNYISHLHLTKLIATFVKRLFRI